MSCVATAFCRHPSLHSVIFFLCPVHDYLDALARQGPAESTSDGVPPLDQTTEHTSPVPSNSNAKVGVETVFVILVPPKGVGSKLVAGSCFVEEDIPLERTRLAETDT